MQVNDKKKSKFTKLVYFFSVNCFDVCVHGQFSNNYRTMNDKSMFDVELIRMMQYCWCGGD
jgi:hypothetical protein